MLSRFHLFLKNRNRLYEGLGCFFQQFKLEFFKQSASLYFLYPLKVLLQLLSALYACLTPRSFIKLVYI